MSNKKDTPDVALIRQRAESVAWNVSYHERSLVKAGRVLAAAKAMIARCNYDFAEKDAVAFYNDECQQDENEIESGEELAKFYFGRAVYDPVWHEQELRKALVEVSAMRSVIARGGYTEISIDQIIEEERTKHEEVEEEE